MEAVRGCFHFYGINYKGCVIQVVLLQNKWVEKLLVYFYNTAVEFHTNSSPIKLMNELQLIEKKLHKNKFIKNGPRRIDIDIIFFNSS